MKINSDIRYALLRYTTILIGIINAFLLPFVLNRILTENQFSIFLTLIGYSVYLVFLDFGYSKPIYSFLRKRFLNSQLIQPLIHSAIQGYLILFIFQFVFFYFLSVLIVYFTSVELSKSFLFLFAIYSSVTTTFIYIKSIFWAISSQKFIEYIDLLLRITNIFCYALILSTGSLLLPYTISVLLMSLLLIFAIRRLNNSVFDINLISVKKTVERIRLVRKPLQKEAKNNFIFSINETLIYNSGFIIFPFFFAPVEIILFGLFTRLFSGISIFIRAISDITIHQITASFFEKDLKMSMTNLKRTLVISCSLSFLGFLTYLFVKKFLFGTWVNQKYEFSYLMDIALFIFLVANSLQHVSGTFITMIGGHFRFLKKISLFLMILTICLQLALGMFGVSLEILILISSCAYAFGAIFYLLKSKRILSVA